MLYLMLIDNQLFSKTTLFYFLQVSEVPYIIFDRLKIKIIYSSKNYFKREQINKTEKETVFKGSFLKSLQFQKTVGFWNGKIGFYGSPHTSGTQGMKLSHIHHYFCTKIIQTGKSLSILLCQLCLSDSYILFIIKTTYSGHY